MAEKENSATIQPMKVKDLKANPFNPRKITEKQLSNLKKSMLEFGDLSGIVYNLSTRRLIGGHQRVKNLEPDWEILKKPVKDKLGTVAIGFIATPYGNISYREVRWSEKKELLANISANKHGGEFDYIQLKDIIAEIDDGSFDIDLIGFEMEEAKGIFDYQPEDVEYKGEVNEDSHYRIQCQDLKEVDKVKKMLGTEHSFITFKNFVKAFKKKK